jgi:hypothetical protein
MDPRELKDTPPWEWPEEARDVLLGTLRAEGADEADRLLAAELAGDLTVLDEELAAALLSVLQSAGETEEVRGRAAIALGPVLEQADTEGFDDPEEIPLEEATFRMLVESLKKLYFDASVPAEVRRRILEASVRAPRDWHADAVRAAHASDAPEWRLTAVFAMGWVPGFDDQILEALEGEDEGVRYHAVVAAGSWGLDAAWPHVADVLASETEDKALLLAAIEASSSIRPEEAGAILVELTHSEDEDIVEAAHEAMAMAEGLSGFDEDLVDEEDEL